MRFSNQLQALQQNAEFLLEINQKQAEVSGYRPFSKEMDALCKNSAWTGIFTPTPLKVIL
jgi:hypothetical protein